MKKIILVIGVMMLWWYWFGSPGKVELGPGVMIDEIPKQVNLSTPNWHRVGEYTLTEFAKFDIKAKVLSKKNYRLGREADLSPTDLALGWGNMSDERILEQIDISQSGRFYHWRVGAFPIPRREIEHSSANMHLIPANDYVKIAIDEVKEGELIEISGGLVNVLSSEDGWRWNSSKTREDTGGGACEIIWVESFTVLSL